MKIVLLERDLEDQYERFLLTHNESLLYYSVKFKNFLKDLLNCDEEYLVAIEDIQIKGVFPLMKKRGRYGWVYNSLPFYGSNGGIIADNKDTFLCLLREYNKLISRDNVGASTVVLNPFRQDHYSTIKYNVLDKRIAQFTELILGQNPEGELMAKIQSSARRNINKAIKNGIKIEINNSCFEFLKNTHNENMKTIDGKSKPNSFFKLIGRYFESEKDYNLYIGILDGRPIAGLLLFYYNKVVEYYIPVIVQEFRTLQPLALIIYQAMIDAFKRGYRVWNWGGTWITQEGVYRFKKKWSTIDREYSYYIQINNPDIYFVTKGKLVEEYDNFYVIPFNKLEEKDE